MIQSKQFKQVYADPPSAGQSPTPVKYECDDNLPPTQTHTHAMPPLTPHRKRKAPSTKPPLPTQPPPSAPAATQPTQPTPTMATTTPPGSGSKPRSTKKSKIEPPPVDDLTAKARAAVKQAADALPPQEGVKFTLMEEGASWARDDEPEKLGQKVWVVCVQRVGW